jgi:hypothetical protein
MYICLWPLVPQAKSYVEISFSCCRLRSVACCVMWTRKAKSQVQSLSQNVECNSFHSNELLNSRDWKLPPRCIWDRRSSGTLRSVYWYFLPTFQGNLHGSRSPRRMPVTCCSGILPGLLDPWMLSRNNYQLPTANYQLPTNNYQHTLCNVPEERRSQQLNLFSNKFPEHSPSPEVVLS